MFHQEILNQGINSFFGLYASHEYYNTVYSFFDERHLFIQIVLGENNLFHTLHPMMEYTSFNHLFAYRLINCSAKYSVLCYSSCRQDVSCAAEFQGQMGYQDVIEIKLVGLVAQTGRVETHREDTQKTQQASPAKIIRPQNDMVNYCTSS